MAVGVIIAVVLVHRVEAVAWLILGLLAAANVLLSGSRFAHGGEGERAGHRPPHDGPIGLKRR